MLYFVSYYWFDYFVITGWISFLLAGCISLLTEGWISFLIMIGFFLIISWISFLITCCIVLWIIGCICFWIIDISSFLIISWTSFFIKGFIYLIISCLTLYNILVFIQLLFHIFFNSFIYFDLWTRVELVQYKFYFVTFDDWLLEIIFFISSLVLELLFVLLFFLLSISVYSVVQIFIRNMNKVFGKDNWMENGELIEESEKNILLDKN